MTSALQWLKSTVEGMPPVEEQGNWSFKQKLLTKKEDFFLPFLENHAVLKLRYQALRCELRDNPTDKELLIASLMLAELQDLLYEQYLTVDQEVLELREDILKYRALLKKNYSFTEDINTAHLKAYSHSKQIRKAHQIAQQLRLIIIRIKRFIELSAFFIPSLKDYCDAVNRFPYSKLPFFGVLPCCFFLLRLITNLFLLLSHVISHENMPDRERHLSVWTRLLLQMQRRGVELVGDLLWTLQGFMGFLLFVDNLQILGTYILVLFYVYDLLSFVTKAIVDIYKLNQLKIEHEKLEPDNTDNLAHLNALILHEYLRLTLAVINAFIILTAYIFTLPTLFNPLVTLMAMAIMIAWTIAHIILMASLDAGKPDTTFNLPSEHSDSLTPSNSLSHSNSPDHSGSPRHSSSPRHSEQSEESLEPLPNLLTSNLKLSYT